MDNKTMDNKTIVSIEGNIGVGKSTFVDLIKRSVENSEVVYEPVEMWKNLRDSNGENILQKFYHDIERWAYSFQNLACISRMIKIEDTIKNSTAQYIFLDRSLGTDKNVFEKMLYDSGKISEIEHQMYNMWCDFYHKNIRREFANIIIYLRCDPKTARERIKKRGRVEEKDISIEYLNDLNKYHESWLMNSDTNKNVIVIDCDKDFESDSGYQQEILSLVIKEINRIKNENENKIFSIKNKIEICTEQLDITNRINY